MRYLGALLLLAATALPLDGGPAAVRPDADRPAEILWDSWGVPHVFAPDEAALFRAVGWAQMAAHADEILRLYAEVRGEAASVSGAAALAGDLRMHALGVPERSRAWLAQQDAGERLVLDAFVDGMNAWATAHPGDIAPPLRTLLPIRPDDPLGRMQATVHLAVLAYDLDARLAKSPPAPPTGGSNALALAPSRTANGRPLLLVQPHPPWAGSARFFEMHLVAPGFEIYGVAPLGVPTIAMGFTPRLGWAHTFNRVRGLELRALVADEDGYRWNGRHRAYDSARVVLTVRDTTVVRDVTRRDTVVLLRSAAGPVLRGGGAPIAVAIAGFDRPHLIGQYLAMAHAADMNAFERALARQQLPALNVIGVDRAGETLYAFQALHPHRPVGRADAAGAVIRADGDDDLWTGYLPYDSLPRVRSPATGWVRNANDAPWYATWPSPMARADYPPDLTPDQLSARAQASLRMGVEHADWTLANLEHRQWSTSSELATHVLDALIVEARASDVPAAREAATTLAAWDRRFDATSRGAVLFAEWARQLRSRMSLYRSIRRARSRRRAGCARARRSCWQTRRPPCVPATADSTLPGARCTGSGDGAWTSRRASAWRRRAPLPSGSSVRRTTAGRS